MVLIDSDFLIKWSEIKAPIIVNLDPCKLNNGATIERLVLPVFPPEVIRDLISGSWEKARKGEI